MLVMSLRLVVGAPFLARGQSRLRESEFVVALSLDRNWFTPDQAARIVDRGVTKSLLSRDGDEVVAEIDVDTLDIPPGFEPDDSLLVEPAPFDRVVNELTATGMEKQEVVAGINELQAELGLLIEAAAVVYARRQGLEVSGLAREARDVLVERVWSTTA